MNKFSIVLTLTLFFLGCNNSALSIDKSQPKFENVFFDAVEKEFKSINEINQYTKNLLDYWFDNNVKISGSDGKMVFLITDYQESISKIDEGKRINIYMKFQIKISRAKHTKIKLINGEVSSFGSISGDFSLNDFDVILQNSRSDLVSRLSSEINSKI